MKRNINYLIFHYLHLFNWPKFEVGSKKSVDWLYRGKNLV